MFPYHARSFQKSHKMKYIYIGSIIAGLLIPLVPIIASMADFALRVQSDPVLQNIDAASGGLGYGLVRFPPILCSPTNANIVYYGTVFPINITMMVGIAFLIIVFWRIHKVLPIAIKSIKPPYMYSTYSRKCVRKVP